MNELILLFLLSVVEIFDQFLRERRNVLPVVAGAHGNMTQHASGNRHAGGDRRSIGPGSETDEIEEILHDGSIGAAVRTVRQRRFLYRLQNR